MFYTLKKGLWKIQWYRKCLDFNRGYILSTIRLINVLQLVTVIRYTIGDITQWNGETTLKSTVDFIQNYYRFSFKIADLPATFLKHYLEKEEKYIEKDNLYITIVAESDGIRGKFKCEKRYLLQDIVIDLHNPEKQFKSNVKSLFGQKIKTKIDWKEFPKYIEAGEADRAEVIQEIRNIIATKEEEARKKKEKNAIVKE